MPTSRRHPNRKYRRNHPHQDNLHRHDNRHRSGPSRPGVGLPRATVSASTTPAATTTTDANGAFRLQVTHSGSLSLTLTAEKACYETASPKTITIANNTPHNATRTITAATRLAGLLGSSGQDEKVTAIILPESLISIGEKAFAGHRKVNGELIIPASVERIGKGTFVDLGRFYTAAASRKGSVKFAPNSKLREIGIDAFQNSIIDTVSELPATLETIGRSAFYSGSFGIQSTNFIIPENVKSIGFAAFGNQNPRVSGKLTIKSPILTRTPDNTTQPRMGKLQNKLFRFTPGVAGTEANPFTTIALHEAVFNSYTQPDLEAIFGTGGQYVDILNETRVLTK